MGGTKTASERCKRQEHPPCRGTDPSHGSPSSPPELQGGCWQGKVAEGMGYGMASGKGKRQMSHGIGIPLCGEDKRVAKVGKTPILSCFGSKGGSCGKAILI